MPDMSYTNAGQPAPAPGGPKGWGWMKGILDFIFSTYNGHKNNVSPQDQHLSNAILANDSNRPLTTVRAINGNTMYTETDMFRRMWLELVDADFTPANFASKAVPINLLTARNDIRGGLGTGDGTGIPGTTAPNVIPNKTVWRDSNGFVPHVYAGQSMEQDRELAVVANDSNNTITIPGGFAHRPGIGWLSWPTMNVTMPAAHPTNDRWDVPYIGVNESGVAYAGVVQGTAVGLIGSATLPEPPENVFVCSPIARIHGSTAIWNYSTVAGGTFSPPTGVSYVQPLHHRATGSVPGDATMQARKLSDFAPVAGIPPTLKTVTILKGQFLDGGAVVDFPGVTITYDGGGTYDGTNNNPVSPSSGTARWDAIYVNNSRQAIVIAGTPAASIGAAAQPAMPTSHAKPVCFVALVGGQTSIYPHQSVVSGTIPAGQGWIWDTIRFNSTGGGSSSGTTTFANVVDDANSSTYKDAITAINGMASSTAYSAVSVSGNVVTITATAQNPVLAAANGRERTITSSITATWVGGGASGPRYLIADLSNLSAGFTIAVHQNNDPVLASYQALIMPLYWDNAASALYMDKGGMQNLDSTSMNLQRVQAQMTGGPTGAITNATANYARIAGGGFSMQDTLSGSFLVPPGCLVRFKYVLRGYVTYVASNPVLIAVVMDGMPGSGGTLIGGTVKKTDHFLASGPWDVACEDMVLSGPAGTGTYGTVSAAIPPGLHSFTLAFLTSSTAAINVYEAKLQVEIYRAPSGLLG